MALPMDSLTLTPGRSAGAGRYGLVAAAPRCPASRRSQCRRSRSDGSRAAIGARWPTPSLARPPDPHPCRRFRRRLRLDRVWRRSDVQGRRGRHDHCARMGDGRPLRHHVFLGDALVFEQRGRLRLASRSPGRTRACAGLLRERTALVMPIYNEAPSRVFGAMQAIFEDVERTGQAHAFDFFLLSDTTDANIWIAEERAFIAMRARLPQGAYLLPAPAQEYEPQGRQYRRLRHSLGRQLSAYGRSRRRQRDDRRRDRAAWRPRWRRTPTRASSKACRSSSTATRCLRACSSSPPGSPARSSARA